MSNLKRIINNPVFQIIKKILGIILTVFLLLMLLVVVVQRFSNNKFNFLGYGIYTVASGSMEPEYNVRDLILTHQDDAKDINVGDDVVYLGNKESVSGKIVTHRVIKKYEKDGKVYFNTKGIANELTDPELESSQILGVVKHKLYILSFCSQVINTFWGFLLLIILPLIVFIFMEGKNYIDVTRSQEK